MQGAGGLVSFLRTQGGVKELERTVTGWAAREEVRMRDPKTDVLSLLRN